MMSSSSGISDGEIIINPLKPAELAGFREI
jgi:hypothetical protein